MDSLLVTPTSEADLQLLTALFKKMKIKARVLPKSAPATRPKSISQPVATTDFVPQTQAEQNMLEAVLELREVLAGRKQAMSLKQFLDELE
ncbi:hypothetical protein [Hymenobacter antarcticus]|uniref:Uncharacterized protein n=1 Tax=Hymenobacter antarcticus TaxID=486270 RepID=A0ABP7PEF5_9BACT